LHRQYDEVTALLAGDALLTFAFELLADPQTHPDPQMRCLLITSLAKAAGPLGMVAGQAMDMEGAEVGSDLIGVTRMNRLKTGALINFSVDAGAMIGCASEAEKTALSRYAHDVGLAFQMVDDLLDAEGVVRDTGKAVRKDGARGKVNFVTVLGVDATRERVGLLAAQAKRHLSMFGPRARILLDAVDFIVERRYELGAGATSAASFLATSSAVGASNLRNASAKVTNATAPAPMIAACMVQNAVPLMVSSMPASLPVARLQMNRCR
jgi:farnesyl diphosphate synthase